jgi:hypothetical protein
MVERRHHNVMYVRGATIGPICPRDRIDRSSLPNAALRGMGLQACLIWQGSVMSGALRRTGHYSALVGQPHLLIAILLALNPKGDPNPFSQSLFHFAGHDFVDRIVDSAQMAAQVVELIE